MKLVPLLQSTLIATGIALAASSVLPAAAVPTLQLDVAGGSYDQADESVSSTNPISTLLGYCQSNKKFDCLQQGPFYISVAVLNEEKKSVNSDFGSFSFNGTSYTNADLAFGKPAGLPAHGVYNTLFKEFSFNFNASQKRDVVNVEDTPGTTPVPSNATKPKDFLYYEDFSVDASGLKAGYRLHFDLYNKKDGQAAEVAPFSHDAYVVIIKQPPKKVPEPAATIGLGLVVAAGALTGLKRQQGRQV